MIYWTKQVLTTEVKKMYLKKQGLNVKIQQLLKVGAALELRFKKCQDKQAGFSEDL